MGKIMKEGKQYGVGGTQKASEITYGTGTVSDALNTLTSNGMQVAQCQLNLPSAVSVDADAKVMLLQNTDLRSLAYNALDQIPATGTLKACVFLWASSGVTVATDTLAMNGLASLSVYNPSSTAVNVSAIRLLVFYTLS